MKKKSFWVLPILVVLAIFTLMANSCEVANDEPVAASGVEKVDAAVEVQASGMTVEQENIVRRLEMENMPGSIKHLYVISAYSGQVIMYSTVKGKVTSSGKRLTPYSVVAMGEVDNYSYDEGFRVTFPGGQEKNTGEVLQDDGTYGHSISYLYWWDIQDRYHQHYVSGGQIIHISDQPIPGVKGIILNVEASQ